ncbi:SIMPL domain-containing protein [Gimesia aquarii]|uniref:Oxidative stress defense protein n=1 Tax=Gimesia aquarii TaxID=2527964 RepID=A0A517VX61_9PLAN|nr:SIMPL domain-containing protein [Gimesia aquarii]QDT97592.1 oxidative stress defense protein [Gimesia aquarii]
MSGMSNLIQRFVTLNLVLFVCWGANVLTVSADEANGITVVGMGSIEAKPSVVELTGMVIGQGQLAGDAVTKYHGNRRRAETAFKNLNIPGLEIVEEGMSLYSSLNASQMQAMMRGMAVNNTQSQQLSVSEMIKIRLTGIDKLSSQELLETIVKIIDSGKDAGVIIGNDTTPTIPGQYNPSKARNTMATFKVTNVGKLKEEAYQKAVQDAKTQAEKLAKLTGVKLGKVVSINGDGGVPKSSSVVYYPGYSRSSMTASTGKNDEQPSPLLKKIPISVAVRVTFSIE